MPCMRPLHRALFASLALAAAVPAHAAGRSLKAADLDTYCRLFDAETLARARTSQPGGGGKAGEAKAREEFEKALGEAGWTRDRYQKAQDVVDTSISYLNALQEGPEEAKGFWDGYEQVDAATVDLVKARRAQLDGAPERARQALRGDQVAAVFGRLATKADLQGTWRRDAAATRAHLMAVLHLGAAQADEVMKVEVEQTLVFSGDQVDSKQTVNGRTDDYRGTYAIQGRDVAFTYRGPSEKLQVGVKSPRELVFGAMGIPSGVYLKQ